MKPRPRKHVGRSIEETMVRRQFDSTNPITWPEPLKGSISVNALPNLLSMNNDTLREQLRSPKKNYLSAYQEEDKQKMMDALMSYCRALQGRVESLEGELQLQKNNSSNMSLSRSMDVGRNGMGTADYYNQNRVYTAGSSNADYLMDDGKQRADNSRRAIRIQSPRASSPTFEGRKQINNNNPAYSRGGTAQSTASIRGEQLQVGRIISDIDNKVLNLKEIFRKGDPIDERRVAATKIASIIRGYLSRQRMRHYRASLKQYKWMRCRMVVYLIDVLLSNQSKLDAGFQLLKMNRTMKTLHVVFDKWAIVCRQNAPIRRGVKIAAEEKIANKRLQLMRIVFDGLKSVSIGTQSTKHANAVRRKLIETIRNELSLKLKKEGLSGVVPEHEISKVLHRRVVLSFWERKNTILSRFVFATFVSIFHKARKDMVSAKEHKFKVLVGKCFFAWSNYVYLIGVGLDRKRWPGPRKYEIRYNQKRIDNFARMRCTRMVYSAWKAYFMVQYKVKQMYRAKLATLVRTVFHGWRRESRHQHAIRRDVMDNWKGYARLMVYNPFHAWANHVKAVKNRHNEQARICNSYVRWKWRQRLMTIIRVWRHQALYGRIDGLYSRQMLLKTLGEQKILVNSVEKLMASQTTELEECKNIVANEITKRTDLETQLSLATSDNTKLKMTNHHYEQELRRIESMVESMMIINPKQVEFLKTMQPKFKFKERNIAVQRLGADGEIDPFADLSSTAAGSSAASSQSKPPTVPKTTAITASATTNSSKSGKAKKAQLAKHQHDDSDDDDEPSKPLTATNSALNVIAEAAEDDVESIHSATGKSIASLGRGAKTGSSMNDSTFSLDAHSVPGSTGASGDVGGNGGNGGDDNDDVSVLSALSGVSNVKTATAGVRTTQSGIPGTSAATGTVPSKLITATTAATALTMGADATLSAVSAASAVADSGPKISDEDLLLLTRAKWLLSRYNDEIRHAEMAAHTQHSLNLMMNDQDGEKQQQLLSDFQQSENDNERGITGDMLTLQSRPPILPKNPPLSGSKPFASNFRTPGVSAAPSRQVSFFNIKANEPVLRSGYTSYNGSFASQHPFNGGTGSVSDFANAFAGFHRNNAFSASMRSGMDGSYDQSDDISRLGGAEELLQQQQSDPTSIKILLSFIDFLDFGDISAFSTEDRRDWIRSLLEKSYANESLTNAFSALTGDFPIDVDRVRHGNIGDDGDDRSTSTTANFTTLDNNMNGAKSWRDALMQFRCYSSGVTAGNASGGVTGGGIALNDENVSEVDLAMFSRILAMRDTSEVIQRRQTAKFREKLHQKLTYQYGPNASDGMMRFDDDGPQHSSSSGGKDESAVAGNSDDGGIAGAMKKLAANRPQMSDILGNNIYASNLKNLKNEDSVAVGDESKERFNRETLHSQGVSINDENSSIL